MAHGPSLAATCFISEVLLEQPHPFVSVLSLAASTLQWQNSLRETMCSQSLKYLLPGP